MSVTPRQFRKSTISAEGSPRLALIGCGAIAEEYYLPAFARRPDLHKGLILVDRNGTRAQQLAERFNVKRWLVDYRQVLQEVDGAIIALPTPLHHPVCLELLAQGIHILCEKPLAESAPRGREIIAQAEQSHAVLAVDYLQRLVPTFARVKELLDRKVLGQPRRIEYYVGEQFSWPTVSGFYFNSPPSAGGVLRDRGAHVIDHICWWLGGKPRLISSQNDSFGGSEAVAHVQFEHQGCTGEVKLSWLGTFPSRFAVVCDNGAVEGEVYDYQSISLRMGKEHLQRIRLPATVATKVDIACQVVDNFADVIRNGGMPLVSGKDVLDSLEFIDECYAAARRFEMPWYDLEDLRG